MKSLRDSLRKTLARRHMGHQMVGAIALNAVRDFLQKLTTKGNEVQQGRIENEMKGSSARQDGKRNEMKSGKAELKIENIEGYVRFKVVFLKVSDQALKIKIFQQKNQILHEVNLSLEKVGYKTRVEEIRLK